MRRTIALMRASEDAKRSAARLAELGHAGVIAPATVIRASAVEVALEPFDAAIATSAKALDLLSQASREAIVALPLFVVGARTARAAAARALEPKTSARDAAALAVDLRARLKPGSRVLYLAGRDRNSELECALAAAGHRVTLVEIYAAEARRAWSVEETRSVAGCDAALHYSTRSAKLALRLAEAAGIGDRFRALLHVCISEEAASPLRAFGALRVCAAATPDEDALLDALVLALASAGR